MTPRSAAEVAFGVLGTYFVASNIPWLIGAPGLFVEESSSGRHLQWVPFLGSLLLLASGVGMIVFRRWLAAKLAPTAESAEEGSGTGGIQAAAIAVIGVYFFAGGLQVFLAEQLMELTGPGPRSHMSMHAPTEMAVGAALFLGARGIVAVWQWLRTAGRSKS